MEPWLQTVLTVVASFLACNGFWAWMQARHEKKDAKTQMLLGLGHDRIVYLCMKYIDRGWISSDEHEDLIKYLYTPYVGLKGNGTAERLVNEINKLPIRKMTYVQQAKSQKSSQP
ncbi:MAG: hypothetical protein IIY33_00235 [Erysipelotrichaceae bacterium]|nr:hypothetical protein [Erysipelotrichaceae bacterium]